MKTITKYLMMMIAMLAMCSFTGCDKDEDVIDPPQGFIGTWTYVDDSGSITFVFSKNGSGSRMLDLIDKNGNTKSTNDKFKYTYSETSEGRGSIQVHISGSDKVYTWTYTLTGDTMMLNDGDGVWVLSRR